MELNFEPSKDARYRKMSNKKDTFEPLFPNSWNDDSNTSNRSWFPENILYIANHKGFTSLTK